MKFTETGTDSIVAIMDRLGLGTVVCDAQKGNFPILSASPLFISVTGLSETKLVGHSLSVLQGSESKSPLLSQAIEAAQRCQTTSGEVLLYRGDGSPFWSEWIISPLFSANKPQLVAVGIRDISERRRTQQKLADDYAAWRGMFDNAVEGIYRSTVDGHYLDVNPALARMYGYERPDQLLNQISDISSQIYVDARFRDIFKQQIAQFGVVKDLEYQVRRQDGVPIWISESARLVRDSNGVVRYYEGFIQDITARKEAERKLHDSQQQLLETSRQVGMAEMASNILHNMGNALNSVNTSLHVASEIVKKSKITNVARLAALLDANAANLADFLTKDPKGMKVPSFVRQLGEHLAGEQAALLKEIEMLKKSIEHVNEIIATQQQYARGVVLNDTVDLLELIEDAIRMNAASLARHGISIIRDFEPSLPQVTVPKHKVLQILMNLIRNAQKACEDGSQGDEIRLRATAIQGGKWVQIDIVDTGVGIAPAILPRLFTHGFTTRKDGHGFGLHSGALMARELGGTLSAKSDGPGMGATFTLEFPCQPPVEKPSEHTANPPPLTPNQRTGLASVQ